MYSQDFIWLLITCLVLSLSIVPYCTVTFFIEGSGRQLPFNGMYCLAHANVLNSIIISIKYLILLAYPPNKYYCKV